MTNKNEFKTEIEELRKMTEEAIDLSEIPELNFDHLGKPVVGKFYRPLKKPISVRMDADVLAWFKEHPHYQRLINKACRLYMLKHKS